MVETTDIVGKCNSYSTFNKTSALKFTPGYEGVPENLILNFAGWLILILFFTIMRKKAWDYGRLALVHKDNDRWTRIFYGTMDEIVTEDGAPPKFITQDRGFFAWIMATFRIKDEHILSKCGLDAVQYLSFQRNVILLVGIMTSISLGIVLPINFAGTLQGGDSAFGHTTVSNLDPQSDWLWVHVTIAILYLPLSIAIMRRFSVKLRLEIIDSVSRTLMITDIPRRNCDVNDLARHFREAYPEYEVQNIQLAYDITKVSQLDQERDVAHQARIYCEEYFKTTGERLTVHPYMCGYIFSCCGHFEGQSVDAIDYYKVEEDNLRIAMEAAKSKSLKRPLGIAFITLGSVEGAKHVYQDHKYDFKRCSSQPPVTSVSGLLQPQQWTVKFAPPPQDIFWENLSETSTNRTWKTSMINTFLVVTLFFLTTPPILLNTMDTLKLREIEKMNPVLSETMPTLLLWTFAALLPVIVIKSDQWMSHWTRSERNHAIMRKTFIFLLFMVLILPSLGLASVQAFLEFFLRQNNEQYRWQCLFLPDKGAFFVNYVITSALIGTGLELIRFPELFLYAVRLLLSRSKAETISARKLVLWEFPFGVHYAWMLLIFALTVVYSLSCPLITPFGLLYMLMKHFVDRYNIYFAYGPSKIKQQIHGTAINFVIVSVVLLQASFMLLSIVRNHFQKITIYAIIGFFITIAFAFAQCFLRWCESWGPIHYQSAKSRAAQSPRKRDIYSQFQYVPDVLRRSTLPSHRDDNNGSISQNNLVTLYTSPEAVETQIDNNSAVVNLNEKDTTMLYQNYNGGTIQT
ncbi:calcium permeable stress-gated cation channel 1 [Planococcus citri]|uniref:calcium permeable stress-gated cation channel 1 n=1 Tax=Planococcus citri TaxID=170843 RepID=UPI0031F978C5